MALPQNANLKLPPQDQDAEQSVLGGILIDNEAIHRVVEVLHEHLSEVDRSLQDALDNWRLERLSMMDRGILRIATTEILFLEDVPPKVSIQEAVHLAARYGGDDSPRFVNGVLDALFKGTSETPE